jgi:hypothetical protein
LFSYGCANEGITPMKSRYKERIALITASKPLPISDV